MADIIDKVTLGKNIRAARESYNWSQERLAEYIDKSTKTIANYENGKSMPTMTALLAIADALGYIVDDVVNGNIEKGPFRGDKEMAEIFWDTTPDERKILIDMATAKLKEIKANRDNS